MALIEVFITTASSMPIDASSTTDIPQGSLVTLDSAGKVVLANGDSATTIPVGIAGDSLSQGVTSYTPESGSSLSRDPKGTLTGSLILGAYGKAKRFTQNRVSDNYNEVLASGKMTVYHSGGEYWTDQYETIRSNGATVALYTPGTRLYASGAEGAVTGDVASNGGKFTDETKASSIVCGVTIQSPTGYPSGVPGTGTAATGFSALPEGGNSLSWGQYLHVKLVTI